MRLNRYLTMLAVSLLIYGILWQVGVFRDPIVKWVTLGLVVVGPWLATLGEPHRPE